MIVTGVESHRTHSHYPENDIKSKKSSIIDALIIAPEDAPFDKAEVASKKSAAPSQKQSSQRGVLMEEEVKSKRSEAQSGNERARSKKSSRLI